MPDSVNSVSDFKVNQCLGQWYELARLDHSFERGLSQIAVQGMAQGWSKGLPI